MKKENNPANLSLKEVEVKIADIESQLFRLRMQKVTGQLLNTALIKTTRKELARLKNFRHSKEN